MRGPGMEKNLGQGIAPKIENDLKEMAMGEDMVQEKRKGQIDPISQVVLKVKFTVQHRNQEEMVGIFQQRGLTMDKVEMGEIKVGMIKGNLGVPNMNLRIKGRKRVIQKILVS